MQLCFTAVYEDEYELNFFLENSAAGERLEDIVWEISANIINSGNSENKNIIWKKITQIKKML